MRIIRTKKFKISFLICLILLFTTLMIIFKLLNNIYFGNASWKTIILNDFSANINTNWFTNTKSFLNGSIGFYAMVQSHLYYDQTFLTPIFLDALINWLYIISIVILIILILIDFIFQTKKVENKVTHEIIDSITNIEPKTLVIKEKS